VKGLGLVSELELGLGFRPLLLMAMLRGQGGLSLGHRIRLWVWLRSGLGSGLGLRPGLCISNRAMVTERVRAMVRAGVRFTPLLRLGVGGWGTHRGGCVRNRDRNRCRV